MVSDWTSQSINKITIRHWNRAEITSVTMDRVRLTVWRPKLFLILGALYYVTKERLVWRQLPFVPLSVFVSAVKPFDRFLWNSVQEVFTNVVEQTWLWWKSAQWQSYFTEGRKWMSGCNLHSAWLFWAKTCAENLLAMSSYITSLATSIHWTLYTLRKGLDKIRYKYPQKLPSVCNFRVNDCCTFLFVIEITFTRVKWRHTTFWKWRTSRQYLCTASRSSLFAVLYIKIQFVPHREQSVLLLKRPAF